MNRLKYTESAEKKLLEFQSKNKEEIEDILISRNFIPGEDFIEVTASDIEDATRNFRFIKPIRNTSKYLILVMYFTMGLFATFFGFLYEDFRYIIEHRPQQAMLVLGGIIIMIFSVVAYFYLKQRDKQRETIDRYINELDSFERNIKINKY